MVATPVAEEAFCVKNHGIACHHSCDVSEVNHIAMS